MLPARQHRRILDAGDNRGGGQRRDAGQRIKDHRDPRPAECPATEFRSGADRFSDRIDISEPRGRA